MKNLESALAALNQRAEKLAARRSAAQTEFETAQAARQTFMLGGDLDDAAAATKLQQRVDSAASALAGLDAAITAMAAQVADAERELSDERQRIDRAAASEKLAKETAIIENRLTPWMKATHELAGLLDAHAHFRFEAGSISRFLSNAASEVEIAMSVTLADLRAAVGAVASGAEPIPHAPQCAPAPVIPPKPETRNLFFVRHGKFTDTDGRLRLVAKFTDAEVPLAVATRALKLNVATADMTDSRRKFRVQGGAPPNVEWCVGLDDAQDESGQREPVLHSTFEKLDRGAPFTIRVPRGPEVAAAARSATDNEER